LAAAGCISIAVAAYFAYQPCLTGEFIWDDRTLIVENVLVRSPDGLWRMWLTSQPIDYWPMTNSSFWLEWRIWGPNTTGYHIDNLVLQVANSILIWIVLRRLAIPGAFLAALLFAVHPVNVESVAWIAQRKNVLSLCFFLLSIWSYLTFDERSAAARAVRVPGSEIQRRTRRGG
jgi:hypothetical protein